jgi:hypothetical protein
MERTTTFYPESKDMNVSGEENSSSAALRALFIETFRLSETRFDVWLRYFNAAIAAVGGERIFASHERQAAVTHWVMLTAVLNVWMEDHNILDLSPGAVDFSEPVLSLKQLFEALADRYTTATAQKNLIELKRIGMLDQRGRGEKSTIHLNFQAIVAVRDTALEWIRTHEDLGRRLQNLTTR